MMYQLKDRVTCPRLSLGANGKVVPQFVFTPVPARVTLGTSFPSLISVLPVFSCQLL